MLGTYIEILRTFKFTVSRMMRTKPFHLFRSCLEPVQLQAHPIMNTTFVHRSCSGSNFLEYQFCCTVKAAAVDA